MDGRHDTVPAVLDLGLLPEDVLLRVRRPDARPSAFWTPTHHAARATTLAVVPPTPVPDVVTELLATAVLVVTVEAELPGQDAPRRGAWVVGPDRVLVALHEPDRRAHAVQLQSPARAAAELSVAMDPFACARRRTGRRSLTVDLDELAVRVPLDQRRSTMRLARVDTAVEPPTEAMLTVVGQHDGLWCCSALPDGGTRLHALTPAATRALATGLLSPGAGGEEGP